MIWKTTLRFPKVKFFLQSMMNVEKNLSTVKSPLKYILQQNDCPFEAKSHEFCHEYLALASEQRINFLKEFAKEFGFDKNVVGNTAVSYMALQDKSIGLILNAAERLKSSLQPKYEYAFNRIRKIEGGIKFLVDVREDILVSLPKLDRNDDSTYYLKILNNYLKEMLSHSFNVGLLNLERITWNSSCHILEKISAYEAVHPVRNWTDLKQRVGPYRRCYVFTHSCMPGEPIVVLHTALTEDISCDVPSIVKQRNKHSIDGCESPKTDVEDPQCIHAAIFYSITSTQKGLHGIELGNQLIKKVVKEVLAEFPNISKLSSLSPIPGFRDWLLLELEKMKNGQSIVSSHFTEQDIESINCIFPDSRENVWVTLSSIIASNRWINNDNISNVLKNPLMKVCAHYLFNEKRRSNALNSVAHFHLRNGAVLWRLNWAADLSPRGLNNSCGIMVNYRYFIEDTEENSKKYVENHYVNASEQVKCLLLPPFTKSTL